MSTFLNASEGIVYRHDKKIIFSTNLPSIDKIDPALLRPGRCFDIIKFDFLTEKQALLVQTTLGLETTDLDKKRAWSLSEILNPLQVGTQTQMREARKLGFHQ
jgi:ATP-dependent 26S proteasome regulatory subunit